MSNRQSAGTPQGAQPRSRSTVLPNSPRRGVPAAPHYSWRHTIHYIAGTLPLNKAVIARHIITRFQRSHLAHHGDMVRHKHTSIQALLNHAKAYRKIGNHKSYFCQKNRKSEFLKVLQTIHSKHCKIGHAHPIFAKHFKSSFCQHISRHKAANKPPLPLVVMLIAITSTTQAVPS